MFNVCFIDVIIRQLNQNTWTFEYSFRDLSHCLGSNDSQSKLAVCEREGIIHTNIHIYIDTLNFASDTQGSKPLFAVGRTIARIKT